MTKPRLAVLDHVTAMHNWRRDPSPENMREVLHSAELVCGYTLELESQLALEREKVPLPRELCTCGGHFRPDTTAIALPQWIGGLTIINECCDACEISRQTTLHNPRTPVDAG